MDRDIRDAIDDRALDLCGEKALPADGGKGTMVAVPARLDRLDLDIDARMSRANQLRNDLGLGEGEARPTRRYD
jgi:hypothetical protein